jgi:maleylpyruvate isomerase
MTVASSDRTVERTLTDSLRWVQQGTSRCNVVIAGLSDAELAEPSALPGWSRAHVVAHLAANAAALRNLARWAATGRETPMYASPDERAAGIAEGATRPPAALRSWSAQEAAALDRDLRRLSPGQWERTIRTAQGREVPATEIPWLRAREVMVHAVDLATGTTFDDLPQDFLAALEADIRGKRGDVPDVEGSLADRVGWLAGRTTSGVTAAGGGPAPALPPWL